MARKQESLTLLPKSINEAHNLLHKNSLHPPSLPAGNGTLRVTKYERNEHQQHTKPQSLDLGESTDKSQNVSHFQTRHSEWQRDLNSP